MEILILQILPRFIIACESDNVAQQYKRKNSKEFKLSWKSQEKFRKDMVEYKKQQYISKKHEKCLQFDQKSENSMVFSSKIFHA